MKASHTLLFCAVAAIAACGSNSGTTSPATAEPTNPAAPVSAAASGVSVSPSRVVTERFHSNALGVDKAVVVYLPRGYDAEPAKHWPVFYYLHGLGGVETSWVKGGHLDQTADQLGLAAIVVMPDGDDSFFIDSSFPIDYDQCMKDGSGLFSQHEPPADTCVHNRAYETYIVKDLVDWVDGKYHTLKRRDGRALAGLSMGGFGATALSLRHSDEFAAAASHSGAIELLFGGPRPFAPGKTQMITDVHVIAQRVPQIGPWLVNLFGTDIANWRSYDIVDLASKLPSGTVALYFDCGTEDDFGLHDNLAYLHEQLLAKHIDHAYFEGPGHHDFAFWSQRLPESLKFLVAHTAKPQ